MFRYRLRQVEALLQRIAAAQRLMPTPAPRQLQSPQDVIDLIHEQVEAIRLESCAGPLEKARVIGYLANLASRAIELGKLAERLDRLEAGLNNRK
jgi:hypothetical protein